MIISASRRTDLPAFYTPWFMNRIREGFVFTRNPFNANQIKRVSLQPDDVDCIVFWTRNPSPLIPHLSELDQSFFKYYFLYTITGYSKNLESNTPDFAEAIHTFKKLSDLLGADRVIWRFDPIIMSTENPPHRIIQIFQNLSKSLNGYTKKVIISFIHLYPKVLHNMQQSAVFHQAVHSDITNVLESMLEIASANDLMLQTCSQNLALKPDGLSSGSCIDPVLIEKIAGKSVSFAKDTNQRKDCHCVKSIDIGAYNTCLHGCIYCYANRSEKRAHANFARHNPLTPFLLTHPGDKFMAEKTMDNKELFQDCP